MALTPYQLSVCPEKIVTSTHPDAPMSTERFNVMRSLLLRTESQCDLVEATVLLAEMLKHHQRKYITQQMLLRMLYSFGKCLIVGSNFTPDMLKQVPTYTEVEKRDVMQVASTLLNWIKAQPMDMPDLFKLLDKPSGYQDTCLVDDLAALHQFMTMLQQAFLRYRPVKEDVRVNGLKTLGFYDPSGETSLTFVVLKGGDLSSSRDIERLNLTTRRLKQISAIENGCDEEILMGAVRVHEYFSSKFMDEKVQVSKELLDHLERSIIIVLYSILPKIAPEKGLPYCSDEEFHAVTVCARSICKTVVTAKLDHRYWIKMLDRAETVGQDKD